MFGMSLKHIALTAVVAVAAVAMAKRIPFTASYL